MDEPPEPVLEAVAALLTPMEPEWTGTATDLRTALKLNIKPNQLSTKLNVNAKRLMADYNICYSNTRTHAGRRITLTLISEEA